ncbi:phage major tail protein, TP901-1 family [Yunchengibacter salinarum]|uniref:phage major tail protein, TP901-1 family n=1 Tax=Yunchengibacter salinarum TaxID=3133399 RepID=UPI0035B5E92A
MTPAFGKDLLFKMEDPAGSSTFRTIGGFRSNTFTVGGTTIDVTAKDSGAFRALMNGGGVRSLSADASGVFVDKDGMQAVHGAMMSGSHHVWRLIAPGFGTYEGPFIVTSLSFAGEHNGEMTYSLNLESAGSVSFAAEAA